MDNKEGLAMLAAEQEMCVQRQAAVYGLGWLKYQNQPTLEGDFNDYIKECERVIEADL
jgi:hypothetical protein